MNKPKISFRKLPIYLIGGTVAGLVAGLTGALVSPETFESIANSLKLVPNVFGNDFIDNYRNLMADSNSITMNIGQYKSAITIVGLDAGFVLGALAYSTDKAISGLYKSTSGLTQKLCRGK